MSNSYKGQIHHSHGGMKAPQSTVDKTNNVRGTPEFSKSQKAVDRTAGRPSSGRATPMMTKRTVGRADT